MERVAGQAAGARLRAVRAVHVILPLCTALFPATIGPEIVKALAKRGARWIGEHRARRNDVAPDARAFRQVGAAGQEVLMIHYVRKSQNGLCSAAQPRMALAADLILLIEGQVLQTVNNPGF